MNYDEWTTELASHELGRLWLSKFRYDLTEGNLLPVLEEHFKKLVEAKLPTAVLGCSPLSVVQSVINENPGTCDLKGQRTPKAAEPYSLIVTLETFATYYLRQRSLLTVLDEGDGDIESIWSMLGTKIDSSFYEGWVKTDRDFFWCTPTRVVSRIAAADRPNKCATTLRRRLGLHRLGKGQKVLRIDVPIKAMVGKKLLAPTTLDAGINPAFVPYNGSDGYGRTLNLRTIRRDVRELVVEKIHFDQDFSVAKIGRVGSRLPRIIWVKLLRLLS